MILPALRRSFALVASLVLLATLSGCSFVAGNPAGPMGPGTGYRGMMGSTDVAPGPGTPGFVAGTVATPRVVRVIAGPGYRFSPSDVRIVVGETIIFEVTAVGPLTHEFKVGPLDAVIADSADVPEIPGIGMMQTGSLTYTFTGPGPFGFACHEPGHFEAGMVGAITVVG